MMGKRTNKVVLVCFTLLLFLIFRRNYFTFKVFASIACVWKD